MTEKEPELLCASGSSVQPDLPLELIFFYSFVILSSLEHSGKKEEKFGSTTSDFH